MSKEDKDELHDFIDWVGSIVIGMVGDEDGQVSAGLKTAHGLVPVYRLQRKGGSIFKKFLKS